jgi:hypothetical protein
VYTRRNVNVFLAMSAFNITRAWGSRSPKRQQAWFERNRDFFKTPTMPLGRQKAIPERAGNINSFAKITIDVFAQSLDSILHWHVGVLRGGD